MSKKGIINVLKQINSCAESDECYTPNLALDPLLKYLPKDKILYDCTSGKSLNIVNYLNNKGFKCIGSENRDFLTSDFKEYDVIITNPPYSIKDKFIEKCYEIGKPFALLLPVSSLQGIKRVSMFKKYGIELLVLDKRIDFTGKGSPHFGVAWFCYNILPQSLIFEQLGKD